jgi:hypothetical protein
MSQLTPRAILDRVAEHLLAIPRARIVNRSTWDAVTIEDALRVVEETASDLGMPRRQWDTETMPDGTA